MRVTAIEFKDNIRREREREREGERERERITGRKDATTHQWKENAPTT